MIERLLAYENSKTVLYERRNSGNYDEKKHSL